MFHRVLYENWHDLVPIVAFVLTFAVFLVAFIRALLMRKDRVIAMSLLPLDEKVPTMEKMAATEAHHEHCHGNCTDCRCSRIK